MSIADSHPEKAERGEPVEEGKVFRCDEITREALRALRETPGFSNNVIAKRLGINVSIVSQYLNDRGCVYPGDVAKLERKIADLLDNETRRRASGVDTITSAATKQVTDALEYIRKTNDAGTVVDDSGDGKSRGVDLYYKEHPTAILYRCYAWANTRKNAEAFILDVAGKSDYNNRIPRAEYAIKKLRGCDRLIILDDAHFLHFTALLWWIHFHEATLMPVALVGTHALLEKVEKDPQIFSRIGLRFVIKQQDTEGNAGIDRMLLKHMVNQLVPNVNGCMEELTDLCEQVAKEHGHYRSVHKQLKLAVELKGVKKHLTWPAAFKAAHTMLGAE